VPHPALILDELLGLEPDRLARSPERGSAADELEQPGDLAPVWKKSTSESGPWVGAGRTSQTEQSSPCG